MTPEKLPPEPERPSAKAAERLQVIVDAAERAALSVIDDAEKEAERYLEEAKARADRIAAERLRETAEELEKRGGGERETVPGSSAASNTGSPFKPTPAAPGREAEEAAVDGEALRESDDDRNLTPSEEDSRPVEPPRVSERPVERLKVAPDPSEEGSRAAEPPEVKPDRPRAVPASHSSKPGSAAARLLATQMAVSGASRQEIEMRLRSGFEIEDTGEILDAILGPEE
jgi:hypothetical protein